MGQKKVVYIAGPITGVDKYWEAFERAEDDLSALGYIPLSPARLPGGLTNAQYMRIDLAMIDSADAVLFLPGFSDSTGAQLEHEYCEYIDKPHVFYRNKFHGVEDPRAITLEWLKKELKEALKA